MILIPLIKVIEFQHLSLQVEKYQLSKIYYISKTFFCFWPIFLGENILSNFCLIFCTRPLGLLCIRAVSPMNFKIITLSSILSCGKTLTMLIRSYVKCAFCYNPCCMCDSTSTWDTHYLDYWTWQHSKQGFIMAIQYITHKSEIHFWSTN